MQRNYRQTHVGLGLALPHDRGGSMKSCTGLLASVVLSACGGHVTNELLDDETPQAVTGTPGNYPQVGDLTLTDSRDATVKFGCFAVLIDAYHAVTSPSCIDVSH